MTEERDELRRAYAEVERELQMRRTLYPRLVANGKLSEEEAGRRLHDMSCAAEHLLTALSRIGN